jgi:hypothetical protein
MRKLFIMTLILFGLSTVGWAKIVSTDGKLFLRAQGKQIPLELVNGLVKKGEVSEVTLYKGGDIRLLSFARKGEAKPKVYSVDEKGFVYSIEPYTNYTVKKVTGEHVQFKEDSKKYKVDPKGFFIY